MSGLKVALIGGGGIAGAHVAAARASGGRVEVAAVIDPAEQACRATAEKAGARPFTCVEDFLERYAREREVGAVVVCTPPSVRVPIVEQVLERGLAVMVEKPLAHNLADARRLAALAGKYPQIPTAVGYCHRFVPAVVEMKRRMDAGELGTVLRFENTFASWNPRLREKWMSDAQISGGGSLVDTGCHSLDMFRYLHGRGEVSGALVHHEWSGRGDTSATMLIHGAANHPGVSGIIHSGWTEPPRFAVTVTGTRASLHYDYEKPTELYFRPCEGPAQTLEVVSHETRFTRQLLAFADRVADPSRASTLATFQDGLTVAEMVDQAQKIAQIV